jgi:hypothetical protein
MESIWRVVAQFSYPANSMLALTPIKYDEGRFVKCQTAANGHRQGFAHRIT